MLFKLSFNFITMPIVVYPRSLDKLAAKSYYTWYEQQSLVTAEDEKIVRHPRI